MVMARCPGEYGGGWEGWRSRPDQTAQPWECSSPLRRKKGRTVEDLSANFNTRWMFYFHMCGGGLVLQCKQRKHFGICGASSICHGFEPLSLFQHLILQSRHSHQSISRVVEKQMFHHQAGPSSRSVCSIKTDNGGKRLVWLKER